MKKISVISIMILLIVHVSFAQKIENKQISAINGVLDLSDYDFNDGLVKLNGEWEFYWQRFLTPQDFMQENAPKPDTIFYIPHIWNGNTINGELLADTSFATYKLTIILPEKHKNLYGFKFVEQSTAAKVWVNDSLLAQAGVLGKTKAQTTPKYDPFAFIFDIAQVSSDKNTNKIELIVQLANFYHYKSGIWDKIEFGPAESIIYEKQTRTRNIFLIAGVILVMMLYHFAIFFLRKEDKSALFFGIFSLLIFLRMLFTDERIILEWFPNMDFEWHVAIEYFSGYGNLIFIMLFFYHLFPTEFSKWARNIFVGIGILVGIIIAFTHLYFYSSIKVYFDLYLMIGGFFVIFWVSPRAIIRKREGAILAFLGIFIMYATAISDILRTYEIISTPYLTPTGLAAFIFLQSIVLAKRFSKAFKENINLTEELDYKNQNLEKIVEQRTAEISQQKEEITAQAEQLESFNKELEKLSIVASQTTNAVIIMNSKGDFEWVNDSFTKIYGIAVEDLTIKQYNLFSSTNNPKLKLMYEKGFLLDDSFDYESNAFNEKGDKIWVKTTLTPTFDTNGALSKIIGIETDITASKLAEAEIRQRNEEIMAQKEELEYQNERIEYQNKQITSSIGYAKTIQQAILPTEEQIARFFDYFLIFKPKDIVSGDFYWFSQRKINNQEHYFIAVVDCTGHGVPGAFMSMVGSRLLSEIVNERKVDDPAEILEQLDKDVRIALKQEKNKNQDGMDLCIVSINNTSQRDIQIAYAGAKRPLYYYDKKADTEISIVKATRRSVGGTVTRNKIPFETIHLDLSADTVLYLSTDGLADQNNSLRKRLGSNDVLRILNKNKEENLEIQKLALDEKLIKHQGNASQRDDITFLCLKLK